MPNIVTSNRGVGWMSCLSMVGWMCCFICSWRDVLFYLWLAEWAVCVWLAECAVLSVIGWMCCFICGWLNELFVYGWLNVLFCLWLAECAVLSVVGWMSCLCMVGWMSCSIYGSLNVLFYLWLAECAVLSMVGWNIVMTLVTGVASRLYRKWFSTKCHPTRLSFWKAPTRLSKMVRKPVWMCCLPPSSPSPLPNHHVRTSHAHTHTHTHTHTHIQHSTYCTCFVNTSSSFLWYTSPSKADSNLQCVEVSCIMKKKSLELSRALQFLFIMHLNQLSLVHAWCNNLCDWPFAEQTLFNTTLAFCSKKCRYRHDHGTGRIFSCWSIPENLLQTASVLQCQTKSSLQAVVLKTGGSRHRVCTVFESLGTNRIHFSRPWKSGKTEWGLGNFLNFRGLQNAREKLSAYQSETSFPKTCSLKKKKWPFERNH